MKKLILASAVVLAGFAVHAGAIYWQMSSMSTNVDPDNWTMARIEVVDASGNPIEGEGTDGHTYHTYLSLADDASIKYLAKGEDGAFFDVTGYDTASPEYSFIVELVNDNFETQGAAAPVRCSAISQYVVSDFSSIAPVDYMVWNPGFVDIPEPSGGLLMLLGASFLALRRRRG